MTLSRSVPFLLALVLAGGAVLVPLEPAWSDVIRLRTGESVKGRPLAERSDETILVMEDFLSGAVRTFVWEVVDPEDRDRLQEDWGWKNKALKAITGQRVVQRLEDGSTQDIRGLVVEKDESYIHLMRGGKILKIPRSQVVEIVDEEIDPRDVYSPDQLVTRFLDELKAQGADLENLSTREHFRVAEYAEKAGAFEMAKTHYQACTEDETFLMLAVARQRLQRVEDILKDAAALRALREIRMALSLKVFRRVREQLEAFATEHPEASAAVMGRLEELKKDFVKRRAEYFQLEAKFQFPKIVLALIKDKVQEKDITLSDASGWTRSDLPEAAFLQLSERLKSRDDVTPEEARTFWENRQKSGWKTASYGSGTFIVNKPKIKPPKRSTAPRSGKSSDKGGAAKAWKPPKPPTRDGWWDKAKPKERQSWIMAFFVQNSGLFEVSERFKMTNCVLCNGEGLQSQRFQSGEVARYLCTRCGGAQQDMRVQWR